MDRPGECLFKCVDSVIGKGFMYLDRIEMSIFILGSLNQFQSSPNQEKYVVL